MVYIYFHVLASVDKGTHGFPGHGQQLAMFRENSKTRRALRRVFRKAEDVGRLSPVKDDNAAKGGPVRPAGMCVLVN